MKREGKSQVEGSGACANLSVKKNACVNKNVLYVCAVNKKRENEVQIDGVVRGRV